MTISLAIGWISFADVKQQAARTAVCRILLFRLRILAIRAAAG